MSNPNNRFNAVDGLVVGNANIDSTTGHVSTSGNVYASNYFYANGVAVTMAATSGGYTFYTANAQAGTTATLIDSFPVSGNLGASYTFTSKDNVNGRYKSSRFDVITDGSTNAYYNEYSVLLSDNVHEVATITANVVSGNVDIWAVGDSANVTVAFQRTALGTNTQTEYVNGSVGPTGATGPQGNVGPQGPSWAGGDITNVVTITNPTVSTSTTTGALIVAGGIGASGNVNAGALYAGQYYYANGTVVGASTYGDTNVAAYLASNPIPTTYGNTQVAEYMPVYLPTYLPTQTSNIGAADVVATGNVTGTYFIGNGALLTGITATGSSYGNTNVASYLTAQGITAYSNVNVAGYLLSRSITDYSNTNVASYLSVQGITPYSNVNVAGYLASQSITPYANSNVKSYLSVFDGDIIPTTNVTYSLGSVSKQWKDLYVSNNTIYIGGIPMGVTNNTLVVNGQPVLINNTNTSITTTGNLSATTFTYPNGVPLISANVVGPMTVSGNLSVANLTVLGTTTTLSTQSLTVANSLIFMADTNTSSDLIDIGLVGTFNNGVNQHAGLVRDASDGTWKLFSNVTGNIGSTVDFTNAQFANLTTGNVSTTNIVATGRVTAGTFVGDGSALTGMYGNASVASYLPTYPGNISAGNVAVSTNITASGRVTAANVTASGTINAVAFVGDGSQLTGLPAGYTNVNVASYLAAQSITPYSNINVAGYLSSASINTSGTVAAASLTASGNVSGTYFIGNGALLTGIVTSGGAGNYSDSNVAAYLPTYTGNLNAGNLFVGVSGFTQLPTVIGQFTADANTYAQLNVQNINSNNQAATEIVATANNGNDTTFFIDVGIAGNTYDTSNPSNSLGTSIYANDAYVYAQGANASVRGGNLVIGATTVGRNVKIFAGGINSANVVANIYAGGMTVTGAITATTYYGDGSHLTGISSGGGLTLSDSMPSVFLMMGA